MVRRSKTPVLSSVRGLAQALSRSGDDSTSSGISLKGGVTGLQAAWMWTLVSRKDINASSSAALKAYVENPSGRGVIRRSCTWLENFDEWSRHDDWPIAQKILKRSLRLHFLLFSPAEIPVHPPAKSSFVMFRARARRCVRCSGLGGGRQAPVPRV